MSYSRATAPENFADFYSSKLLCQPEPQYVFAQLFLNAFGSSLPIPSGLGLDGRQMPTAGAAYSAADRDRLMLAQALPSSLFALGVDFNKKSGGTVKVNRPLFTDSTYTVASRKVGSGQSISTTAIDIASEQTHLTLERYAGPYSSTVKPYAIEAFDANMGLNSATSIVGMQLTRDFHKFLDQVHVVLGGTGTAVYPENMTAVDDATTAGSFPMSLEQISRTEQLMDTANLPTLPDGKRVLMLTPLQWKQLKHDPEYKAASDFHTGLNLIYGNYVDTVGKFHIFVSNTLATTANSSSVAVQYGIAMAPGGFMGGMGRRPSVRVSSDDNYGETVKAIWLADLAFGISDSRMFYSVRSA
jgi:hypothetical protein